MVGEKCASANLAGLFMRRSPPGQIPVLVPIEDTAPVITEGSGLAVPSLIQWCAALPAARMADCDAWGRVWYFLLPADTGQEGFYGAQGQSCGFCDC